MYAIAVVIAIAIFPYLHTTTNTAKDRNSYERQYQKDL